MIAISAHTVYFPIPYPNPVPNPQNPLKTALAAAIGVLFGVIFRSEPENSRIFTRCVDYANERSISSVSRIRLRLTRAGTEPQWKEEPTGLLTIQQVAKMSKSLPHFEISSDKRISQHLSVQEQIQGSLRLIYLPFVTSIASHRLLRGYLRTPLA
jgi:hypothetical protein